MIPNSKQAFADDRLWTWRPATSHDFDFVQETFEEGENHQTGIVRMPSSFRKYFSRRETLISGEASEGLFQSHFYIIMVDKLPIGILTNRRFLGQDLEYVGIILAKKYQGMGIGSEMFRRLVVWRKSLGKDVQAMVAPINTVSKKMCRFAGGEIMGKTRIDVNDSKLECDKFAF